MRWAFWLLGTFCTFGLCVGLKGLSGLDRETEREEKFCRVSMWQMAGLCAVISGVSFGVWEKRWAEGARDFWPGSEFFFLTVFSGCLLTACIMDVETHKVYDYVWWIAVGAALLLISQGDGRLPWSELLCFVLLQELLFSGMYGRADSHAFCVCALWESIWGLGLKEYLIHML